MRGIVIAAGRGVRMRPFSEAQPKCLLPIAGRTLLDWTVDGLRGAGCDEVVVITGHAGDAIDRQDVVRVTNTDYINNNILHSLMYARGYLDQDCLVSYSDIWVEPQIHRQLAAAPGRLVVAADMDWQPYYLGRTEHPLAEAENLFLHPDDGRVTQAGKHLDPAGAEDVACAEFLGLWKMTADGARRFVAAFDAVDAGLSEREPFQQAHEWRKAYITDMLQHMIDAGERIGALQIARGWAELDTQQDYDRLPAIAERQRLDVLVRALEQQET